MLPEIAESATPTARSSGKNPSQNGCKSICHEELENRNILQQRHLLDIFITAKIHNNKLELVGAEKTLKLTYCYERCYGFEVAYTMA